MKGELITFNLHTVLYIQAMQSSSILIHFPQTVHVHQHLNDLGLKYEHNGEEFDVIVDNIDELDDEQLCSHYNINYDLVNCIEAVWITSQLVLT